MKEPAARGLDRARGPTHFCETTVETLEKPHSGVSASDRCGAHKKHTQAHTSIRKQLSVKWAEGGRHRHRREPRPRDRESGPPRTSQASARVVYFADNKFVFAVIQARRRSKQVFAVIFDCSKSLCAVPMPPCAMTMSMSMYLYYLTPRRHLLKIPPPHLRGSHQLVG